MHESGDSEECSQMEGINSLGENQIGDVGAQAIAEALKVNTTLTEL